MRLLPLFLAVTLVFIQISFAFTSIPATSNYLNTTGGTLSGPLITQNVTPSVNATYDSGNATYWWRDLYALTIYLMGINLTAWIEADNATQASQIAALSQNDTALNGSIDALDAREFTNNQTQANQISAIHSNLTAINGSAAHLAAENVFTSSWNYFNNINASQMNATSINASVDCSLITGGDDADYCTDSGGGGHTATGFYLWNDTTTIYFNETELNTTMNTTITNKKLGIVTQVNITTTTYNASLATGPYVGYVAGNVICNQTFSGTHLCTEFEVTDYVANNNITGNFPDGDGWIIGGSPKYVPASIPVDDCNGFKYDIAVSGTHLGNYWKFNSTHGGNGAAINCATKIGLACCKVGT